MERRVVDSVKLQMRREERKGRRKGKEKIFIWHGPGKRVVEEEQRKK